MRDNRRKCIHVLQKVLEAGDRSHGAMDLQPSAPPAQDASSHTVKGKEGRALLGETDL